MNKGKICFYLSCMGKGGAQRVVVNLAEYLLEHGYEVTIVTTEKWEDEYELPSNAKRVLSDILAEEVTGSRVRNFVRRFRKLRSIWKEEKPDVILSMIGKNNMMAIMTSFCMKNKVLVAVRANPTMEYYTTLLQIISKTLFICADGVILQTDQQKEYFPRGIRRKSVILPNPLNPEFLRELPSKERQKQIISVGRVDENKNHQMLVQAFDELASSFPEWRLVICGDGVDKEKLDQEIQNANASDRIEAPGMVSDVAGRMADSRIFVLTSREEGMPNALMEAMSMGLAVISTDCPCGGPAMLIRQGENGILIPVDDKEALKKALYQIFQDEEFERELANQAIQIREELSIAQVGAKWMQYIEKIIR